MYAWKCEILFLKNEGNKLTETNDINWYAYYKVYVGLKRPPTLNEKFNHFIFRI